MMDIKISRIDNNEDVVEFRGRIVISHLDKSKFEKELNELIAKYAV